ncbi:O-acetyl-ADP-ribose deacetylase [Myroides phaeus]|uniref:O-acetyl-ADP-ribose deacetylase n=1 Tax=Myroides phaeus TaxID=702745 RepID=UPI002DBE6F1F|nr:O-acetyl-ADP-ribose deacetylase [Myroides phaeus]MEC4117143.1 O-acetyl-ADP-ribose deacetylase [Myroides phaeus]
MNTLKSKIEIIKGDITTLAVDAIVNAANSSLLGGGGVDGAIHSAGGSEILEECRQIVAKQGGCNTGEAVITTAGKMPAKYVIHTVGPIWHGGDDNEAEKLRNCYHNSLTLAVENGIKTIAFPSISTGVYRFPKEEAAEITVNTMLAFLKNNDQIEKITIVSFNYYNFRILEEALERAL